MTDINCPQCYARRFHFVWCPTLIEPLKEVELSPLGLLQPRHAVTSADTERGAP